jgi:hypothetical protein
VSPAWARLQWAAAFALLVLHALLSVWPALTRLENDFANYWVPAWSVFHGRPVASAYDARWFAAEAPLAGLDVPGSFVPQPPANALLLVPLAGLPPSSAKALWSALLAAALVASFWVLRGTLTLSPMRLGLLFLVSTAATRNALVYGQPYPLLLLCLCLAWRAWRQDRFLAAGLWLSPLIVLKLYGLPFVIAMAVSGRRRAWVGLAAGLSVLALLSVMILGWPIHAVWLREVLPASLIGRVQDPYSSIWGSVSSLSLRLFQGEPDFNPLPVRDWPSLARALPMAWMAFLAILAGYAGTWLRQPGTAARGWALLGMVALCASPLTSTYHFVLLLLPLALLVDAPLEDAQGFRAVALLGLGAFAMSSLTHFAGPLAHGFANLLAYPRLVVLLILLALAAEGVGRSVLALAAALGVVTGALALLAPVSPPPGERVPGVSGYLAADPAFCEGVLTWRTIDPAGRPIRRALAGVTSPACEAPPTHDPSNDGRLVATAEWRGGVLGSWDVVVHDRLSGAVRTVIGGPANETAPVFTPDGKRIVFASDWRRGLGATSLFAAPLSDIPD